MTSLLSTGSVRFSLILEGKENVQNVTFKDVSVPDYHLGGIMAPIVTQGIYHSPQITLKAQEMLWLFLGLQDA